MVGEGLEGFGVETTQRSALEKERKRILSEQKVKQERDRRRRWTHQTATATVKRDPNVSQADFPEEDVDVFFN